MHRPLPRWRPKPHPIDARLYSGLPLYTQGPSTASAVLAAHGCDVHVSVACTPLSDVVSPSYLCHLQLSYTWRCLVATLAPYCSHFGGLVAKRKATRVPIPAPPEPPRSPIPTANSEMVSGCRRLCRTPRGPQRMVTSTASVPLGAVQAAGCVATSDAHAGVAVFGCSAREGVLDPCTSR